MTPAPALRPDPLTRRERWTARVGVTVLLLGLVVAVRGVPAVPVVLVAAEGLERVLSDGSTERVRVPDGAEPAGLLRLSGATAVLLRDASGSAAFLLRDTERRLRFVGPADRLVPDTRPDRFWTVTGADEKDLVGYDAAGRETGTRRVRTPHDLLLVTPEGVLDDEVVVPGGSTPTLRADDGRVLARLPGPVRVLDVRGGRLLVTRGSCLTACTVEAWGLRGAAVSTAVPAGLVVTQGALSADGASAVLAGRLATARGVTGQTGQAVLLRGRLGTRAWTATVAGGCSLLACRVAWHDDTALASVDRAPGSFVRWPADGAVRPWSVRVPAVVALAGL